MKKATIFLFTILPIGIMIGIQVIGMTIASLYITAVVSSQTVTKDIQEIIRLSEVLYQEYAWIIYLVVELFSIFVFGLWFYGKRKKIALNQKMRWKKETVLGILSLVIGVYLLTSYYMIIMQQFFPNLMNQYSDVIQNLQLDDLGILSIFNVVLLAPIGEELIFRGITMYYTKRLSNRFWIANAVQALLFGVVHLNVIQGIYAFALGLLLGYLTQAYGSIYVAMILHGAYNFFGTVGAEAISQVPFNWMTGLIGVVLLIIAIWYGVRQINYDLYSKRLL